MVHVEDERDASPSRWRLTWTPVGSDEANGSTLSDGSISADGRYVVFSSAADDIVPNDVARCEGRGCYDVFIHDRALHRTAMVSVDARGLQRIADSVSPRMSADGRRIAYTLVEPNSNGVRTRAVLQDLVTGSFSVVARDSRGRATGSRSDAYAISDDGRFVLFSSNATALTGAPSDAWFGFFVRDTGLRRTIPIYVWTVDAAGIAGGVSLSGNGRTVALWSYDRLAEGDDDADGDLYVRDLPGGAWSLAPTTEPPRRPGTVALSRDGTRVAFYERLPHPQSPAGLPPHNVTPDERLVIWNRTTGERTIVADTCNYDETQNYDETAKDDLGYVCPNRVAWSRNERYLAFEGDTALTPDAETGAKNVYRFDTASGDFVLASVDSRHEPADGETKLHGISGDGSVVTFASGATNIVPGDRPRSACRKDGGLCWDVFIRDIARGTTTRASARGART